jgi:flavin-dependent dehydrogenase
VGGHESPMAVAIRGYAPTPPGPAGAQVIRFGTARQPSYAWSFDRGDGLVNVGYGELFGDSRPRPTRALLLEQLEDLLPGSTEGGTDWRGHQLPLSTFRPLRPAYDRVLLVGDAAGLVNPMTGEGIYHAVLTGILAGQAAAASLAEDGGVSAGARYVSSARKVLAAHQRHIAVAAQLARAGWVLDAGIRASAADKRVFDDIVELGLADGRLTTAVVRALAGKAVRSMRNPIRHHPSRTASRTSRGD